jgi:hypothetical protein
MKPSHPRTDSGVWPYDNFVVFPDFTLAGRSKNLRGTSASSCVTVSLSVKIK